jgi:xylulokinase
MMTPTEPDIPGQRFAGGRYVLAVDLGTSGLKVGLVSLSGTIVWHEQMPLATQVDGDAATQDAAQWWELVRGAAKRGVASGVVAPDRVVAVSVTGQWASTVPVDGDGRPVGPCLLWMDTRGRPYSRKVIAGRMAGYAPAAVLTWIRHSGGAPSPSGADPIGHIRFLQAKETGQPPAPVARWFLEPVDYLSMCFTGSASASHASMVGAWLTDNRHPDVLAYDPVLVGRSGVDPDRLPPLRPSGSVVGTVRAAVAAELGLAEGVRVVAGTPDLHSAAVGAGAVLDYQTHLAVSTSAWIGAPVPGKKTDVFHQVASVPGVGPARYLIADNHETGGACLDWTCGVVPGLLDADGRPEFARALELAAEAPPGSHGVLFTPWLRGERSPVEDRHARAGFHNLSLTVDRADLVRSVLEGVAYNNRWLHDAVEHFAGRRLDPLRMVGGGAQSDLWCQIHADVMDRTIERVEEPMLANLRGAALIAGLTLGAVRPAEVSDLVGVDAVFRPDRDRRRIYDHLFHEFPRLYKAQRGTFARLNRWNGVPRIHSR